MNVKEKCNIVCTGFYGFKDIEVFLLKLNSLFIEQDSSEGRNTGKHSLYKVKGKNIAASKTLKSIHCHSL